MVATNENSNYPIQNTVHRFMHKYFLATTTSAVVTITCNADVTANCIFIGYHNITSGSLVLKNSAGATLSTITLTSPTGIDPYKLYFAEQTMVRSMVLTLGSTTDNLYVGAIGIGDYLTMPGVTPETTFGRQVNSAVNETEDGYLTGFNRAVLANYQFTFPAVSQTELNSIVSMLSDVGYSSPVWLDTYESDTTIPALYCRISALESPKKLPQSGIIYSTGLTFKEIR